MEGKFKINAVQKSVRIKSGTYRYKNIKPLLAQSKDK